MQIVYGNKDVYPIWAATIVDGAEIDIRYLNMNFSNIVQRDVYCSRCG